MTNKPIWLGAIIFLNIYIHINDLYIYYYYIKLDNVTIIETEIKDQHPDSDNDDTPDFHMEHERQTSTFNLIGNFI